MEGLITCFEEIIITECARPENKHLEGLTMTQAAQRTGKHQVDVMLDLAVSEDLKTEFFAPATNRNLDLMKEVIDYPYVVFGVSDGGAHTKFLTAGRYPTESIIKFCREKQWLTLEEIHWRLSALPAFCVGLNDRGFLREGAPADIVVYDLDKLARTAGRSPARPARQRMAPRPALRRLQWTIVNGEVIFEEGACTGATPASSCATACNRASSSDQKGEAAANRSGLAFAYARGVDRSPSTPG